MDSTVHPETSHDHPKKVDSLKVSGRTVYSTSSIRPQVLHNPKMVLYSYGRIWLAISVSQYVPDKSLVHCISMSKTKWPLR